MYLLDTNVISEMRRASRHGSVLEWISVQLPETLFLPSIAFLEMQRGIELTRLQNPLRAAEIETWADELAASANILDFDTTAAREYSRLARSKPEFVSEDAMIAAIAKVHGLTVATRNIKHFEKFNVPLVDPFKYRSG